jgi:formate--tetrahydrofolate ligase
MEDINLHFTGDFHAIGTANNLLAALLDNHVYQGNALHINPKRIVWRRVLDMNDRQLRYIVDGLGGRVDGVPREDGFDITAASEIMAVFCLSKDLLDLKRRLSQMVVAYTREETPVTVRDLKAEGALTALLSDAFHPNLVQTLEGTPALVHGGPFANIAHGCNSLIATSMAMRLGGIVITEAGFGADLGAEKFLDIKCRAGGLWPDAVVVVATARALKHHGGCAKEGWDRENMDALKAGMENLKKHLENLTNLYRLPVVVGINRFPGDTQKELDYIREVCQGLNVPSAISEVFEKGGRGGIELAEKVNIAMQGPKTPLYAYGLDMTLRQKIEILAKKIYGARDVVFSKEAETGLNHIEELGYGHLPICMAKTPYSLSDDAALPARPAGFTLTVRQVRLLAGAGFVVALTGEILTMPGLPRTPAAEKIDVDAEGRISGLF